MNQEFQCDVYFFDSDKGPVWITRLSPKDESPESKFIDFPDRMMQKHPELRRRHSTIISTEFVDDRMVDN